MTDNRFSSHRHKSMPEPGTIKDDWIDNELDSVHHPSGAQQLSSLSASRDESHLNLVSRHALILVHQLMLPPIDSHSITPDLSRDSLLPKRLMHIFVNSRSHRAKLHHFGMQSSTYFFRSNWLCAKRSGIASPLRLMPVC